MGVIALLGYLVVAVIVLWLVFWLLQQFPLPEPIGRLVQVVAVVVVVAVLIFMVLQFFGLFRLEGFEAMASNPGVPLACLPGAQLNPVDWIDGAGNRIGAQQSSLMRGTPGALTWWQRRQVRGPSAVGQGWPFYLQSRPYDRGAGAFAPKFGGLLSNVIGAGVLASYKLPVIAGPGARYEFGAIWFDVQTVPTTMHMSRSMRQESVNALIASSHVAAMYPTTG